MPIITPYNKSNKVLRISSGRSLTILLGIVCLILAVWSAIIVWSTILTIRPEKTITYWQKNNSEFNLVLANKMITRLKRSISLNPSDANTHLVLAQFYQYLTQSDTNEIPKKNTKQNNLLAEQEYKEAIENQPSWDYAWAKLANFYSKRKDINDESLISAISQAMLLGPYEGRTQKIIIPLIFKHWHSLQISHKRQLTQLIKVALKGYTSSLLILDSANKYNKLNDLMPLLEKKWHKDRVEKYMKQSMNLKKQVNNE